MIRTVIVDDEQTGINSILRILHNFKEFEVIGTYTDSLNALLECVASKPDVAFLDISMPKIDGFEVAKQLLISAPNTKIIFVTAYDEYAVNAFEISSLDYILKPVSLERFSKTVDKIKKSNFNTKVEDIENVISQSKVKLNKVIINENEKIYVIDPVDIFYITVDDNEVVIVTENNRYKTKGTLTCMEERMGQFDFYRCHKSFIVNLQKISEVHYSFNNTFDIKLKGKQEEIPVSRRYAVELKKILEL